MVGPAPPTDLMRKYASMDPITFTTRDLDTYNTCREAQRTLRFALHDPFYRRDIGDHNLARLGFLVAVCTDPEQLSREEEAGRRGVREAKARDRAREMHG